MADVKISALSAESTAPIGTDLLVTTADPGGTPASKKMQLLNLAKAIRRPIGTFSASASLALTDAGLLKYSTGASNVNLTVTKSATVTWETGTEIYVGRGGNGTLTLVADTGVTILSTNKNLELLIKFSFVKLTYLGTNIWWLSGEDNAELKYVTAHTTSYTLTIDDFNGFVRINSASDLTVTFPPNSSVNLPIGSQINVQKQGTGAVTLTQGSGVSIIKKSALTVSARYGVATCTKTGTDQWVAHGDLD